MKKTMATTMEKFEQVNSQSNIPKMKPFETVLRNFAMAGISPKLVTQSYPINGKIFMGFLILGSALISAFGYTFHEAKTFIEYTQSIYMGSIASFIIFILLTVILNVEKLFEFIHRCDYLLNTTLKYSAARSINYETNQLEEKISKISFFVIIEMTPAFGILAWTIYTYFIYFTTDLGADAFELPQPMWFPFDWKNPFGYLIVITMQYIMLSYAVMIGGCVLVLAIGAFLYGMGMSKNIKGSLFAFNRNIQAKTDRFHLVEQISEFLELHSRAKQIITNFSDIYQHFITFVFIWSLITICGVFLMIQIELVQYYVMHHSDNLMILLMIAIEIIYAFGVLFISCELGQRLNLAFDECSEMVDQFEWYLFPAEIQRMLPIIINFTHQPFEIICFGSAACDRETFKSIINTAFSYFTVLRQLYN